VPAINLLTDTAIRAAMKQAAAGGRAVKKSDGGGLVLLAQPDGVRGWWRLRTYSDGREGMLSIGGNSQGLAGGLQLALEKL
jgi:hypothetical protein